MSDRDLYPTMLILSSEINRVTNGQNARNFVSKYCILNFQLETLFKHLLLPYARGFDRSKSTYKVSVILKYDIQANHLTAFVINWFAPLTLNWSHDSGTGFESWKTNVQ